MAVLKLEVRHLKRLNCPVNPEDRIKIGWSRLLIYQFLIGPPGGMPQ